MDALLALGLSCLPQVLLVSLRAGTALALLPVPFGDVAPVQVRAALSVMLALCAALPSAAGEDGVACGQALALTIAQSPAALLPTALGEVAVGLVIGLTVRVTLAAVETAGALAGVSMGLGFASSIDPTLGEEVLPPQRIVTGLGTLAFFVFRGHHAVVGALAATARTAPPGRGLVVLDVVDAPRLGADVVAQGLRIAAPVVATMFLVQTGVALVARSAPRVQVFGLTFGVATAVGMLVLGSSAPAVVQAVADHVGGIGARLVGALGGMP
jgi:flagellar biosynthetic protein FliR